MPLAYSISTNSICRFYKPDFVDSLQRVVVRKRNLSSNKRKINELSRKAQKRLKKSSENLIFLSKKRVIKVDGDIRSNGFRAAFVTLKLPAKQMHEHSEIIRLCLNQFLVQLRKYYRVKNYVWKSELQKNGNIHFHLLIDRYVHYMAIRKYWNQSIEKLGYVSEYRGCRENMNFEEYNYWRKCEGSTDVEKNRKAYEYGVETNWNSPNSTDVKLVDNDKKAAAYISKYISKTDDDKRKSQKFQSKKNKKSRILNEFIDDEKTITFDFESTGNSVYDESKANLKGRLWFQSQSLSRLKNLVVKWNSKVSKIFKYLESHKKTKSFSDDFFNVLYFNSSDCGDNFNFELQKILISHAYLSSYPFPEKFHPVYYHN